jgi:hypothetical protein
MLPLSLFGICLRATTSATTQVYLDFSHLRAFFSSLALPLSYSYHYLIHSSVSLTCPRRPIDWTSSCWVRWGYNFWLRVHLDGVILQGQVRNAAQQHAQVDPPITLCWCSYSRLGFSFQHHNSNSFPGKQIAAGTMDTSASSFTEIDGAVGTLSGHEALRP